MDTWVRKAGATPGSPSCAPDVFLLRLLQVVHSVVLTQLLPESPGADEGTGQLRRGQGDKVRQGSSGADGRDRGSRT